MGLGIETATTGVGVALCDEEECLALVSARAGRRHVEALHPMIAEACKLAEVDLEEIDGIAVDLGPGLFTGIRVGLAAAEGLSLALSVPVTGVTSLEALAAGQRSAVAAGAGTGALVDMRRGEVAYSFTKPRSLETTPPSKAAPSEAARLLVLAAAEASCPLVCCGDGVSACASELTASAREHGVELVLAGEGLAGTGAAFVAREGLSKMRDGNLAAGGGLEPLYMREPDARINWASAHGGR